MVTGWGSGTGAARFRDLVRDTGQCRFGREQTEEPGPRTGDPDVAAATSSSGGLAHGWAAVRIEDVIVAVTVVHPDGEEAAVALARELTALAVPRAKAAGLPGAT